MNVSENLVLHDARAVQNDALPVSSDLNDLFIYIVNSIAVKDVFNDLATSTATIYYINSSNQWIPLTGKGTGIIADKFDHTYAQEKLFLANFSDRNRYIQKDGVTVVDSTDGTGNLYNTPNAYKINYYKNRLYLANFIQYSVQHPNGVRYPTTVLRSSFPLGIVALVNSDYPLVIGFVPVNTTIDLLVTETHYFYADSGANQYDVYRGNTFLQTITVSKVNETSITVGLSYTKTGDYSFLAGDEIWVAGTYTGEKVYRWVNNPSISGQTVKQYDTFQLLSGDNQEIKMMANIGNVMMVANSNSIASWNDYTLEGFDMDVGCVSMNGYIKNMGVLYFLHYTGIYATTGSTPQILSNKVQRYIYGATKAGKENCAAGKKGTSVFFTIGDVTLYKTDGSLDKLLKNVCLEYNITQQNWFVHTNVNGDEFDTRVEESNTDRLEMTDTAGNHAVKEFLSGETDDGEVIHMRLDFIKMTLQPRFENVNNPISLLIDTERGAAIKSFINLNNGEEYYPLPGDIRKGLSNIKIVNKDGDRGNPPIARLLSVSLRDSSPQICKISRMTIIFVPTTNDDPNSD